MAMRSCGRLLAWLWFMCLCIRLLSAGFSRYPAVFNFGDSNSDTGGLVAAMGAVLNSPYGQTFFELPSGRFSDGRLLIDFLVDAIHLPFLNPYLDSIATSGFRRGCNFAVANSTILPATASPGSPFSFGVQLSQFLHFKAQVLHIQGQRFDKHLPPAAYFEQGLYMIDLGQNDLSYAFYSMTEDEVIASIPLTLSTFEAGIKTLFSEGARKFWVHNTRPLGCLASVISQFGTDPSLVDDLGCVSSHNRAARLFNLQLRALCAKLRHELVDSNIIYVDIFSIKWDLIENFSSYGFQYPLAACCGYGGPPLNYDSQISCGQTKNLNGITVSATGCSNFSEHVNWDGIHYTEAANQHVFFQLLTGKYTDPPLLAKM